MSRFDERAASDIDIEVPDVDELWWAGDDSPPMSIQECARWVADVVHQRVRSRPARVVVKLSYEGHVVCRLEFPDWHTLYFKTGKTGHVTAEAWVYETVRQLKVPCPDPIDVDASMSLFPLPFLITKAVDGVALTHETAAAPLYAGALRQAGEHLARIHSVDIDGFGEVNGRGTAAEASWWEVAGA